MDAGFKRLWSGKLIAGIFACNACGRVVLGIDEVLKHNCKEEDMSDGMRDGLDFIGKGGEISRPSLKRQAPLKVKILVECIDDCWIVTAQDEIGHVHGTRVRGGDRDAAVKRCKELAITALEGPCDFEEVDLCGEEGKP